MLFFRSLLLTSLLCFATTPLLPAASRAQQETAEDAGVVRGPLLIQKRTVTVKRPRRASQKVGPIGGDIIKALLSGDGRKLAIFWEADQGLGDRTGRMEMWDVASNARVGRLEGDFWPQGMAWRPQSDMLAWVDWSREDIGDANGGITIRTGYVWFWDGRSATPRKITVPGRKMFSVAFTRDGRRVVAACGDVRIRVWNYASGKLERNVATQATAAQYAAKLRSKRR